VNQNVVTYPVIIEVANPEGRLRPKMTANVTIDVATVRDVLRVPNAALRFKPAQAEGAPPAADPVAAAARSSQAGGPAGAAAQMPRGRRRGGAGGAASKAQTVYVMGADKKLTPVEIRTGISDGRFTQVVSGNLKATDLVVVGLATSKVESAPPMGGQGPGGAGGGGRRR
jgi:HlyD family secretion protein